jgi:hypothetical protein
VLGISSLAAKALAGLEPLLPAGLTFGVAGGFLDRADLVHGVGFLDDALAFGRIVPQIGAAKRAVRHAAKSDQAPRLRTV